MTHSLFQRTRRIRFSECDPAGIVFYPQYFVMFNDLMEAWVDELVVDGFRGLIIERRVGMPTVRLEADFRAISRMGDLVTLELEVERVGTKSLNLAWRCMGEDGELRMGGQQTIVFTSLDTHRAIAVPDDFRQALVPAVSTL
ncbi:acyl-CoA thioesterase [Pigmentiphaga aceris]|uniref:Acyl-CoA thioesterase n=1 Tax=Pigmentiphaga aceris TaxID=1940612 RepID=A0A5C0ATV2_9BURK|nr:thioesterase family protein [Pigmentiphaga aceris]QEI05782.1 acyl-CoA thioesterase [Pigmentiphaga aceris]